MLKFKFKFNYGTHCFFVFVLANFVLANAFSFHADASPSAKDLLIASDRARGGIAQGVSWKVDLESKEDGEDSERSFLVKARGNDALVESTSPSRTKGEVYLFNDRNMWFFSPRISKPISISVRQRLSGQAANGDIASTNYARDYDASIVGEEALNGEKVYRLELKARSKQATYDKIRYYISSDKRLGVKAEFLSVQGEPMKVAVFEYHNQLKIDGKSFPFISKMMIQSAAFPENRSTITYLSPSAQTQSSSLFNVNNLRTHE